MSVLVIDRDRLAGGTSGRAAGGLSPDAHPEFGEEWHVLARESLELHRRLDGEWDYGLRAMDLLVLPDFVIPHQAHVNPLRMCAAFARHAGTLATAVSEIDVVAEGEAIRRVRTSRGEVRPGAVVFATGRAPAQAGPVRQTYTKGHLLATEPGAMRVDQLLVTPVEDLLFLQLPHGSLVAGGTKDHGDESEDVSADVIERIHEALVRVIPEAGGLRVTHRWCCFRPIVADTLPVVDRIPGLENAWLAAGFYSTGLLMAPVVGRLLAEWIAGTRPGGIESFAIDRVRAAWGDEQRGT